MPKFAALFLSIFLITMATQAHAAEGTPDPDCDRILPVSDAKNPVDMTLSEEDEATLEKLRGSSAEARQLQIKALQDPVSRPRIRASLGVWVMNSDQKNYGSLSLIRPFFSDVDDDTFLELISHEFAKVTPAKPVVVDIAQRQTFTGPAHRVVLGDEILEFLKLQYMDPNWEQRLEKLYLANSLLGDIYLRRLAIRIGHSEIVSLLDSRQAQAILNTQVVQAELGHAWDLLEQNSELVPSESDDENKTLKLILATGLVLIDPVYAKARATIK